MNLELGVIVAGFLGMAAWNWRMYARLDAKLDTIKDRIGNLEQRLARIEGWIAGRFREETTPAS